MMCCALPSKRALPWRRSKTLFLGFGKDTPLSGRWQALAHAKLAELDTRQAHSAYTGGPLELSLKCGCVRIEDCTLIGNW
jgi:hypothetical protein